MSPVIVEADLDAVVLECEEGWVVVYGPAIATGKAGAERSRYRDVVLVGRPRWALERPTPSLPLDAGMRP